MSEPSKLHDPGVSVDRHLTSEIVPQWQLQISSAQTLSELSSEYVFFTPALLYLFVHLDRDPVSDFFAEYQPSPNTEARQFQLRFPRPVFRSVAPGGGTNPLLAVLWAIERRHWQAFTSYLGSLAIFDRSAGLLVRLRPRTVRIADPLWLEKLTVLPERVRTVDITVFCLDTNKGCVWIEGPCDPVVSQTTGPYQAAFRQYIEDRIEGKPLVTVNKAVGEEVGRSDTGGTTTIAGEHAEGTRSEQGEAQTTTPSISGTGGAGRTTDGCTQDGEGATPEVRGVTQETADVRLVLDGPKVYQSKRVLPETVEFAKAWKAGLSNPYDAVNDLKDKRHED